VKGKTTVYLESSIQLKKIIGVDEFFIGHLFHYLKAKNLISKK
jgi:hypothetical protein